VCVSGGDNSVYGGSWCFWLVSASSGCCSRVTIIIKNKSNTSTSRDTEIRKTQYNRSSPHILRDKSIEKKKEEKYTSQIRVETLVHSLFLTHIVHVLTINNASIDFKSSLDDEEFSCCC
jgi:hypothetical protein